MDQWHTHRRPDSMLHHAHGRIGGSGIVFVEDGPLATLEGPDQQRTADGQFAFRAAQVANHRPVQPARDALAYADGTSFKTQGLEADVHGVFEQAVPALQRGESLAEFVDHL